MSIKKENPKVDFVKNEHEILDYWSKNKTFEKLVEKNSNGPKWSFLDGPITLIILWAFIMLGEER